MKIKVTLFLILAMRGICYAQTISPDLGPSMVSNPPLIGTIPSPNVMPPPRGDISSAGSEPSAGGDASAENGAEIEIYSAPVGLQNQGQN